MSDFIFLKLGGSLITDKTRPETVRPAVLARLAAEIQSARQTRPDLRLLLGHGSGSFGHVAATRYGTRDGVSGPDGWHGFAEVAAAAARLNRLVVEALLAAGIPALSFQPSASLHCAAGQIQTYHTEPITRALNAGLVPVIYGDVAFDVTLGGTIVSTEELFTYLAPHLKPGWLLLAGETKGVLDASGALVPIITPDNYDDIAPALGGSRGADVTGGMASKVVEMLQLAKAMRGLRVRVFSGMDAGSIKQVLERPEVATGTLLSDVS